MGNEYNNLKNGLRGLLNRCRIELLLSDLLTGCVLLLLFFLFYLSLYFCIVQLSTITVTFKTALFFIFRMGIAVLFLLFIVRPLIMFFLSMNLKKDKLLNRILTNFSGISDIFITLYHLAFNIETVSGDKQLKEAAFVQKYRYLEENKMWIYFPRKKFIRNLFIFIMLLVFILANGKNFSRLYSDLNNYEEVKNPKFNIEFTLLNESLNVEYGKPFKLKLKIESEYLAIENVFICFGGGEFLMDKNDSLFVYDFDVINNDIRFNFKTSGIESKPFQIKVLPTPEITDYQVMNTPPAYTGLKPELLKNVVDFRTLYGSVLKFDVDLSNVDTLFLKQGNTITPISLKSATHTTFLRTVNTSGEYVLLASNKNFIRKDLINFSVTCIPDLYPGIQVSELQDSLKNSVHYFYGIITDDYGFSDLRFNYSINGKTNTVMPINVVKNINTQEFYFEFDFAEFAGMDKSKINYFFEVFDNDVISGPKSTRSDEKNYLVPDLNTIFDYNMEVNNDVNSSLKEAEKLAKDIVSGVKDLQKKMLDNSVDNWEKQQLAKDIVDKKNKLDKLLNQVKEENMKKSSLNQSFTKQDSVLLDKQEKVQELLDKIMDDEMKKLMDEFAKLSEEFSKDKFQNLDEKMRLSFDQMSEELDRNIELLKRFQIEEQHGMINQQLDKLKKDQNDFSKLNKEKSVSKDTLNALSKELKNKLENIKKNYNNLLKDNQALETPYDLKNKQQKFEELSQKLDKQSDNASNDKKDDKLSEDIKKKMDELSNEMQEQQQQNFMEMKMPQNDIELIIQNILLISLSQEDLLQQFPGVSAQSARYNELGRLQDMKKLEYKIVKDSLSVLAKSNLMLASILSDKFYDIEIKFGLLPDYIQNNKRNELKKEQQFIVNYLNDIALSLADALQKSKANDKGSGSGSKGKSGEKQSGSKKGGDKEEGYEGMKKFQNSLKQQLDELISNMKKGEKGKPLQQGIGKMIRQNELFKKSLSDFMSENSSLSNTERQLLNEINKLLEDNIRDIANYSISNNLINRNNQIFNKLLMSEKASKKREEYEDKRKSTTAADTKFNKPELYFNSEKKAGMIKTDLRRSDIKLNPFFKNMYNNYYIKLGDE